MNICGDSNENGWPVPPPVQKMRSCPAQGTRRTTAHCPSDGKFLNDRHGEPRLAAPLRRNFWKVWFIARERIRHPCVGLYHWYPCKLHKESGGVYMDNLDLWSSSVYIWRVLIYFFEPRVLILIVGWFVVSTDRRKVLFRKIGWGGWFAKKPVGDACEVKKNRGD